MDEQELDSPSSKLAIAILVISVSVLLAAILIDRGIDSHRTAFAASHARYQALGDALGRSRALRQKSQHLYAAWATASLQAASEIPATSRFTPSGIADVPYSTDREFWPLYGNCEKFGESMERATRLSADAGGRRDAAIAAMSSSFDMPLHPRATQILLERIEKMDDPSEWWSQVHWIIEGRWPTRGGGGTFPGPLEFADEGETGGMNGTREEVVVGQTTSAALP